MINIHLNWRLSNVQPGWVLVSKLVPQWVHETKKIHVSSYVITPSINAFLTLTVYHYKKLNVLPLSLMITIVSGRNHQKETHRLKWAWIQRIPPE